MGSILVVGASGSIGRALTLALAQRYPDKKIFASYRRQLADFNSANIVPVQLDVTDESAIQALAPELGELDRVVNATGMLHDEGHSPEKSLRQIERDFFLKNIEINTLPTLYLAKHLSKNFKHARPAVFASISAKVASIGDNQLGGWTSYRCAKVALNMALKNISIEWKRTLPNVTVAALHPGTTESALSQPFQKNVPSEKLFSPQTTANYLMAIIEGLKPEDSGKFWSWDGSELPW